MYMKFHVCSVKVQPEILEKEKKRKPYIPLFDLQRVAAVKLDHFVQEFIFIISFFYYLIEVCVARFQK